jgi:chromosome segregation protein
VQPKAGAEVAVMRSYTQTLVVESREDLELVAAFAAKNKIKDYSLFCLEQAAKGKVASHFLESIQNVSTLADAWKRLDGKGEQEIWIGDGAFMDRRAVLFFAPQSEQNVFVREAELKQLDSKLKELDEARISQDNLLKELQKRKNTIYAERLEIDKLIRKLEMKLIELNFGIQRQNGDLERFKTETKQLENDLSQVEESLKSLTKQLKEMQTKHTDAKTRASEKQTNSSQIHADLEKQAASLKGEQSQLQQKESSFHKLSEDLRKTLHALHVIEVKDVESQQQEKRLEDEIQTCREMQSTIKVKNTDLDKLLNEAEALLQKVLAGCTAFDKEVAQRKIVIEKWDTKLQEQRAKIKKLEDELHQTAIQGAHTASSIESIQTELQERFNLTIEELKAGGFAVDKTMEQVERQIRTLRQELEAAGKIFAAIYAFFRV